MQAECAYLQAIADLLSEEEDMASPWFWPEWHMLFHAIMISRIYADCQSIFLQRWFFLHPQSFDNKN
jgi:hypothetical protein